MFGEGTTGGLRLPRSREGTRRRLMMPRRLKSVTMAAIAGLGLVCAGIAPAAEPTVGDAQSGGFVAELSGPFVKDRQLKMSIIPQFQILRGQAPLNCLVRLQWDGPGLLEGRV